MTRFAIDAGTAIRIARESVAIPEEHQLVAPKSLQSHALSQLYREVRAGSIAPDAARNILDGITSMHVRLLGDRVSRGHAWRIAEQLGWDDIGDAEYVAVAQLQADAFVTLNAKLARAVAGIVPIALFEELTAEAHS